MPKMQQRSTGPCFFPLQLSLLVILPCGADGFRIGIRSRWQRSRLPGGHDGADAVGLARLKPLSEWAEWKEQRENEQQEIRGPAIKPVRPSVPGGGNLPDQAKNTFQRMRELRNISAVFRKQMKEYHLKYFHGWTIDGEILKEGIMWWVAMTIWLYLYFAYFYRDDREVEPLPCDLPKEPSSTRPDVADVALVFYHPDSPVPEYDCIGREKPRSEKIKIRTSTLDSLRVVTRKEGFLDTFRTPAPQVPSARTSSSMTLAEMRHQGIAPIGALMDRIAGRVGEQSLSVARSTLLQEFYAALPVWGFDASICKSVCMDKLYVCIYLRRKQAVDYHLVQSETRLQIQSSAVQRLGIDQPKECPSSSPPYVRYDAQLAERLHNARTIPSSDPRELYRTFHLPAGDTAVVNGVHRTTLIIKEITDRLNLDAACQAGLMLGWYPVHQPHELDKLKAVWVTRANLWKVTYEQPLSAIEKYFGSRIAFNFGWNGHYCKALLALVPAALLWSTFFYHPSAQPGQQRGTKQILGFSLVLTTWGRIADNLWNREEMFFNGLWDVDQDTNLVRPQYRGDLGPSPIDGNLVERTYPVYLARRWQLCSSAITLAFCAFVAVAIYAWDTIFDRHMNLIASIMLAIQIKIFETVYSFLVVYLLEWENHKYEKSHFNSFLWKQFIFASVNNYTAFAYLILNCKDDKCLSVAQRQIEMTMALLSFMRLVDVALEGVKVKWKIWSEDKQVSASGAELKPRCFTEEQEKFSPHDVSEQINLMLQLVISLGYIFIFGPAAPAVVPFCFIVFVVQLRSFAFVLTRYKRRPFPHQALGVGRWKSAMHVLMRISIFSSAYLLTSFGTAFEGAPQLARLSGFVVFCIAQLLIWWLVDALVPAHRCEVSFLLLARRAYVQRALLREGSLPSPPDASASSASTAKASSADEVREGMWSEIPGFEQ